MPLYEPDITHPNVTDVGPASNGGTATATPAALTGDDIQLKNGVRISNESADEALLVYAPSAPDGCWVHADTEQWFPAGRLSDLRVARAGSVDVAYSYYAD